MRAARIVAWPRAAARVLMLAGLVLASSCAVRGVPPADRTPSGAPATTVLSPRGEWRIDVLAACAYQPANDTPRSDPGRVGGLSGLAYEPDTGTWLAVSDDQGVPRLHRFRLHLEGASCRPELLDTIALQWPTPSTVARRARDFEDLVRLADGSLLLVSEADDADDDGSPLGAPGIHHVTSAGVVRQSLPVPRHVVPRPGTGVRDNAAFESIAVTADGGRVFVAVEQPLLQDDDVATFSRGGASRLLEFRREGDGYVASREFSLPIDPVPHPRDIRPRGADIGVVALVALDDATLLMLERSFVHGTRDGGRATRNDILLSRLVLDEADDVTSVASLRGAFVRPLVKQRLLSLADVAGALPPALASLDNFEGMAFGPRQADGSATLVLVSDDNFNPAQRTAFVVLRLR